MNEEKFLPNEKTGLVVSDLGRVMRIDKDTGELVPVNPHWVNGGKNAVVHYRDPVTGRQKNKTIASIMLEAFKGRPSEKAHVCMIDPEGGLVLSNLEWRHVGEAKLKQRRESGIGFTLTGEHAAIVREIAASLGLSYAAVVRRAIERYAEHPEVTS